MAGTVSWYRFLEQIGQAPSGLVHFPAHNSPSPLVISEVIGRIFFFSLAGCHDPSPLLPKALPIGRKTQREKKGNPLCHPQASRSFARMLSTRLRNLSK